MPLKDAFLLTEPERRGRAAQGRMGGSGVSQQAEGGGGGWRGPGPLPWLLQEGTSEVGPASWSKVVIGEFE